ncbi:MAG: glycosyltransferase family 2 protein [Vicingaceae bacterium]|nr:glycosyltransferase family 2 protein [Vicingaceae bacterium]
MLRKIIQKLREIKHNFKLRQVYYTWRLKNGLFYLLNPTIRKQLLNPFSIPIIIISFNQLFYLQQLIDFLLKRGFTSIVIVDNNSNYQPLLDYFNLIEQNKNITIHRLKENYGHLVFWENELIFKKYSKGFYVVTDADILPLTTAPKNFMRLFLKLLVKTKEITKVGFSLYLDDIPDSNPNKTTIVNWEKQFWLKKHKKHFDASIDTTFALYRPNYKRTEASFLSAIRTNTPYTARHGGWYLNPKELTEEQKHYIKTANNSSSWLTNEKGELKNDFYKDHYKNHN